MKYRVLWFAEIILIVLFFLVLALPIQDYAMREFKEYLRNPSAATRKAFDDKKQEESQMRRSVAIFIALGALVLTVPLYRNRPRNPNVPVSRIP
jgi:uncharacterized membrane protein